MRNSTITQAKANFSRTIGEIAESGEPLDLRRRSESLVVIVPFEQYHAMADMAELGAIFVGKTREKDESQGVDDPATLAVCTSCGTPSASDVIGPIPGTKCPSCEAHSWGMRHQGSAEQ